MVAGFTVNREPWRMCPTRAPTSMNLGGTRCSACCTTEGVSCDRVAVKLRRPGLVRVLGRKAMTHMKC